MRPSRSQCRETGNGGGEDSSRLSDETQTTPLFGLNFGSGPGLPRSTLKGPLRKRGRFRVACAMTPAKTRTAWPPSSGEWSLPKRESNHEPHHRQRLRRYPRRHPDGRHHRLACRRWNDERDAPPANMTVTRSGRDRSRAAGKTTRPYPAG